MMMIIMMVMMMIIIIIIITIMRSKGNMKDHPKECGNPLFWQFGIEVKDGGYTHTVLQLNDSNIDLK